MNTYDVTLTYLVPAKRNTQVEAKSADEARRLAIAEIVPRTATALEVITTLKEETNVQSS